jgi:hypothetical protein
MGTEPVSNVTFLTTLRSLALIGPRVPLKANDVERFLSASTASAKRANLLFSLATLWDNGK